LDLGRIKQHQFGDVGGCGPAEDRPAEAGAVQPRQVSAVVDVRVREDDGVEFPRLAEEDFVLPPGLRAAALEQAAIEENAPAVELEEVLAAGDLPRSAEEREFHCGFTSTDCGRSARSRGASAD